MPDPVADHHERTDRTAGARPAERGVWICWDGGHASSPEETTSHHCGVCGSLHNFVREDFLTLDARGALWTLIGECPDEEMERILAAARPKVGAEPGPSQDGRAGTTSMPGGGLAAPRVEAAVRELLDPARRVPALSFPRAGDPVGLPGLYAWFADPAAAGELSRGLGCAVEPGLIYAGQAGAGRSTATLRSRLRGNHLGGSITGSTFRLTLASVLGPSLGLHDEGGRALAGDGEAVLSGWMRSHLAVAVSAEPDRALVTALEGAVLARLDPPLNLQGMAPTELRSRLTALRTSRPKGDR